MTELEDELDAVASEYTQALLDVSHAGPTIEIDGLGRLLHDLSLDRATFWSRYRATQEDVIQAVGRRLDRSGGSRDLSLSAIALFARAIDISSRYGRGEEPPTPAELEQLGAYVKEPGMSDLIRDLYRLPAELLEPIEWEALELHRLGTTSLILQCGYSKVLKLSHILFNTIGPIAQATASYHDDWGGLVGVITT